MRVKQLIDEDIVNYKKISMFLALPNCSFKCDKEAGVCCCQNSALTASPVITIDTHSLIKRYLTNRITNAIVLGGLEPMDSFDEVKEFIELLRNDYHCGDTVVIYTGYNESEIPHYIAELKKYSNIIVKFGRFVPNQEKHFDDVLGVCLASPNQYAIEIN